MNYPFSAKAPTWPWYLGVRVAVAMGDVLHLSYSTIHSLEAGATQQSRKVVLRRKGIYQRSAHDVCGTIKLAFRKLFLEKTNTDTRMDIERNRGPLTRLVAWNLALGGPKVHVLSLTCCSVRIGNQGKMDKQKEGKERTNCGFCWHVVRISSPVAAQVVHMFTLPFTSLRPIKLAQDWKISFLADVSSG